MFACMYTESVPKKECSFAQYLMNPSFFEPDIALKEKGKKLLNNVLSL